MRLFDSDHKASCGTGAGSAPSHQDHTTTSEARVVFAADGRVSLTTPDGRAWYASVVDNAAWTNFLRDTTYAGTPSASIIIDGRTIQLMRMDDGNGAPWYLAEISAPRRRSPKWGTLTRTQQDIAELATHGATVPEMARHLERAPDTIRAHLREIYRRLGICSRVELVRVLEAFA